MPKVGEPSIVWLKCPKCGGLFYIERDFYLPYFDHVLLHCPFCGLDFPKEKAANVWGIG